MFDIILEKLKQLVAAFAYVDKKLGYKKFVIYISTLSIIYICLNIRPIVREVIEFIQEIQEQIHEEKLIKRDYLLSELSPILRELRAETGADRILYFEYHNSKKNLIGIPFKYVDLVQVHRKYGVPKFEYTHLKNINSGVLTGIYEAMKKNNIIINNGDGEFASRYPEDFEYIAENDEAVQHCFINLPGVHIPVGFIVLEWNDRDPNRDWDSVTVIGKRYMSRINALIIAIAGGDSLNF